ncbi:hypothetical protein L1987_57824 [Smallanthus sonchifolius]|uniref:Uncharacterized protein n=1 Tax=Smallanthus sonchifolius TaxID=185202 RepID=A0ACB9DE30_9ASTR|nr:hypothetical protein L1987_57824 [Smallanthus sonchifolius]
MCRPTFILYRLHLKVLELGGLLMDALICLDFSELTNKALVFLVRSEMEMGQVFDKAWPILNLAISGRIQVILSELIWRCNMGALDEGHYHVVLENGFETLTGDVNKEGTRGNTLEEIAGQKAGIFKKGVPAYIFSQPPEAMQVLKEKTSRLDGGGGTRVADAGLHAASTRSSGGGAPAAVEMAYGQSVCG